MLQVQRFVFNGFAQNTYLVYDNAGDAILFDAGNGTPSEDELLLHFIDEHQLNLRQIVLTHAHIDHVLGLLPLDTRFGLPVLMHEAEEIILRHSPATAQRYGLPYREFQGAIGFLTEGDGQIEIGSEKATIIHVPGHSPGSLVFYFKDSGFLIGGDVLFQGSIGRTDLYMGNHEQLISGIRQKLFTLPDDTIVYPGHGDTTTIGFEKQHNPFLV